MTDEYVRSPLGEEWHRSQLRDVAALWHGGQWSALYAFASSGTATAGLACEADACAEKCDDPIEADQLRTIATLEPKDADEIAAEIVARIERNASDCGWLAAKGGLQRLMTQAWCLSAWQNPGGIYGP